MSGFDPAEFFSNLIIYMVVWLFAVSAHEAAHAWTSMKFGDDTALRLGRVTLNPIPHIDPIGTLILPILGFVMGYIQGAAGVPLIMWGKPTPVNPLNWRNKDTANICVSLAGIAVNLLIATVVAVTLKLLVVNQIITAENLRSGLTTPIAAFLYATVILNVGLAVFNLLPLPPLDGSKALQTILPDSYEPVFNLLETYGFLIILILAQMGIIAFLVTPIRDLILYILGI
jgi:Zn-dependent protease